MTDDNFATIEKAIEEGRGVYENIRKSVIFLLSSNLGELMTMFAAVALGLNAANLGIGMDALTVPMADFMAVFQTNIGWNFAIARQAALMMKEKGGGSIVFKSARQPARL